MTAAILTIVGFSIGSIPFALVIGKLFFRIDIRNYGDGNPGATNLWKSTNFAWGALAYLCDFFKGAIPVALCFFLFNIRDFRIVPVALAPIAGHAFSPFLRFRGGKAIAASYGVWSGLTIWEMPLVLGLTTFFVSAFQKVHAWTQVTVFASSMLFLLVRFHDEPYFYTFLIIWLGNLIITIVKHAGDMDQPPQLQSWMWRLHNRNK